MICYICMICYILCDKMVYFQNRKNICLVILQYSAQQSRLFHASYLYIHCRPAPSKSQEILVHPIIHIVAIVLLLAVIVIVVATYCCSWSQLAAWASACSFGSYCCFAHCCTFARCHIVVAVAASCTAAAAELHVAAASLSVAGTRAD